MYEIPLDHSHKLPAEAPKRKRCCSRWPDGACDKTDVLAGMGCTLSDSDLIETTAFVGASSLLCKTIRPSNPRGAALFVHGWGGSHLDDLPTAQALAMAGIACCVFNQRPRVDGEEEHDLATRPEALEDLKIVYDWFAHGPMPARAPLGVVGFSYGGYLAALLTKVRPVPWLVLRSPAIYPDRDWQQPKQALLSHVNMLAYRTRTSATDTNAALCAMRDFQGPSLLVTAGRDRRIPQEVFRAYAKAATQPPERHVIACADHELSAEAWRQDYKAALVRWALKRRRPSTAAHADP
jgi:alpha-beta hydrolase superfamily lysophospholipase